MNRGEIRTSIIESLREESDPVSVTAAELNEYIDDGYEEMAELTGAVVRDAAVICPPNEHFIALPSDCLYPIAIRDTVTGYPIDLKHWTFIDRMQNHWIRISRSRPWYTAAWDLQTLILFPAYQDGGSITITQAVIPPAIASDFDTPDLPLQHHIGLVRYGHHRALLKDADGPRLGRSLRQRNYYLESMMGLEDWAGQRHEGIRFAVYGTKLRDGERFLELGDT